MDSGLPWTSFSRLWQSSLLFTIGFLSSTAEALWLTQIPTIRTMDGAKLIFRLFLISRHHQRSPHCSYGSSTYYFEGGVLKEAKWKVVLRNRRKKQLKQSNERNRQEAWIKLTFERVIAINKKKKRNVRQSDKMGLKQSGVICCIG